MRLLLGLNQLPKFGSVFLRPCRRVLAMGVLCMQFHQLPYLSLSFSREMCRIFWE
jgi:hypothetical protein